MCEGIAVLRDLRLDVLRLLGVLIIMLAHAGPPAWLDQLRNFGTPLLIIASALTYSALYDSGKLTGSTWRFWSKRSAALLVPVWSYLTVFFALFYVAARIKGVAFPFSVDSVVESYRFARGIGFVWIVKVYLLLALLTPIVLPVVRHCRASLFWPALLVLYAAYEVLLQVIYPQGVIAGSTVKDAHAGQLELVAYAILYVYALRIRTIDQAGRVQWFCLWALFAGASIVYYWGQDGYSGMVPTQEAKYPPSWYYLAYALMMVHLSCWLIKNCVGLQTRVSGLITWLSSHSYWLYLHHILPYHVAGYLFAEPLSFGVNWLYLTGVALVLTYTQYRIVKWLTSGHEGVFSSQFRRWFG